MTFCGLFDENWRILQESYLGLKHDRRKDKTGLTWSIKLSAWMLREARQVWLARNKEVHEPDDGNSKAEQEILEQVRTLYGFRDDMSHLDRTILDEPIDTRLQ